MKLLDVCTRNYDIEDEARFAVNFDEKNTAEGIYDAIKKLCCR